MNLPDIRPTLMLSILDMRSRPGQSLLACLSLFIGVLSLIGIVTASTVARDVWVAKEEQTKGRAVTIGGTVTAPSLVPARVISVDDHLRRGIEGRGGAYSLTANLVASGRVRVAGGWSGVSTLQISLVTGQPEGVRRLPMQWGQWPLLDPQHTYPAAAVLNRPAAEALGVKRLTKLQLTPPGGMQSENLRVVGVTDDNEVDPRVYVNLVGVLAQRVLVPESATMNLAVHVPGGSQSHSAELYRGTVRASGLIAESQPARLDGVADIQDSLRTLQLLFAVCALITLLVSAIGILNIGLANIRERARELQVRRALGARRIDISLLVMMSSVWVAVAAASAALVTAWAAVHVIGIRLASSGSALDAPAFPWMAATAGAGVALLTALAGATIPAISAARLDVAHSLRE